MIALVSNAATLAAIVSMVGAENGIKYADSNIEIYEYDETSEEYKSLSSGGSVGIEGMEGFTMSATSINGPFVLFATGDISQELKDTFESYGK